MTRLTQALERARLEQARAVGNRSTQEANGRPDADPRAQHRDPARQSVAELAPSHDATPQADHPWNLDTAHYSAEAVPVDAPSRPVREVARPAPPGVTPRPQRSVVRVAAGECPGCQRTDGLVVAPRGRWDALLARVHIHTFQCARCGQRFHRVKTSSLEALTEVAGPELLATFLPPDDGRDFKLLLHEMAEAEQRQRQTQGAHPTSARSRVHDLRPLDSWLPADGAPKRVPHD